LNSSLSKIGGREGSIESQQKFDFFSSDFMPVDAVGCCQMSVDADGCSGMTVDVVGCSEISVDAVGYSGMSVDAIGCSDAWHDD